MHARLFQAIVSHTRRTRRPLKRSRVAREGHGASSLVVAFARLIGSSVRATLPTSLKLGFRPLRVWS